VIVREQANSFNGGIFATNWRVPGNMLEAAWPSASGLLSVG
jgi:hypothetical protein